MTERVDVGDRIAGEVSTRSLDSNKRRPILGIGDFGDSGSCREACLLTVDLPAKRLET